MGALTREAYPNDEAMSKRQALDVFIAGLRDSQLSHDLYARAQELQDVSAAEAYVDQLTYFRTKRATLVRNEGEEERVQPHPRSATRPVKRTVCEDGAESPTPGTPTSRLSSPSAKRNRIKEPADVRVQQFADQLIRKFSERGTQQVANGGHRTQTRWRNRIQESRQPQDLAKVKCFRCHQFGHYRRNCRTPRSQLPAIQLPAIEGPGLKETSASSSRSGNA